MFVHATVVEAIKEAFPSLRSELEDETWAGLLHLEVGCFAAFTQQCIDAEDRDGVRRCFDLADSVFANCDASVKNAMYVSYLEHLDFSDGKKKRAWAFEGLPPRLKEGYLKIHRYLEELSRKKG